MYKATMLTQGDAIYNFRIYKMVHLLWKLEVIDNDILLDHIFALDNGRAVGVTIDYHNYTMMGAPGNVYQF